MRLNRSKLFFLIALLLLGLGIVLFRSNPFPSSPQTLPELIPSDEKSETAPGTDRSHIQDESRELNYPTLIAGTVRAEFVEYAERVQRQLPRLSELKGLSRDEVHGAPGPIKEAAVLMGQVAELVAKNPSVKPEALDFYQKCSLEEEFPTPVRAICLDRALRLYAELNGKVWGFDRKKIPASVIELSKKL